LTAALLFSWIQQFPNDLGLAVQNSVNTLQCIIQRTKQYKSNELVLIHKDSMNDILKPSDILKVTYIKYK